MKENRLLRLLLTIAASSAICSIAVAEENQHFHPKGKLPSKQTIAAQKAQQALLPFADRREFEEVNRGFIAAPNYRKIMAESGRVSWDMGSYDWLLEGKDFDSIHPSLQRQAVLNMAYGLYEVLPDKIYQVRGFDAANITFIKSNSGWIVADPLTAEENAAAALKFVNQTLGERPVVAVIYSHSHADHYGGVRGVVDEADVLSGKVKIIAPIGFAEHAASETVLAGNAMIRRTLYQFGILLPRSPFGHVDQSLGKNVALGKQGLILPTVIIAEDIQEMAIDGVRMIFQNTPGTEAPAEMNAYFPDYKVFWAAENITGTIHNIYTLRGALIRDALEWSKQINRALYLFGQQAEVMFSSHNWPRWGNARIQQIMRVQRDTYANLNNGVLHLANQGVTINQIHNVYQVPESLQQQWAARSYHGSVEHNSRAVINRYLGYWDANPATIIPLSPEDSAPLYVEMMGGAEKILSKGRELYDQGHYRLAMEILNKLVYAEPDNQMAKDLLADVFEQIGYQQESTSLRNTFLAATNDLRSGNPRGLPPFSFGPDTISAMSTGLWLDFLGIRLDSEKAVGKSFAINLVTPDTGEKFLIELSNATLSNIEGFQAENPDLTISLNRSDLEKIMLGSLTLEQQESAGLANLVGNKGLVTELKAMLVGFSPEFPIMPGTGER